MGSPLSSNLRERDVKAVSEGVSRRRAAEQQRPDVRAEREDWFEAQDELDPDRLVFLDETATTTNMVRRYG